MSSTVGVEMFLRMLICSIVESRNCNINLTGIHIYLIRKAESHREEFIIIADVDNSSSFLSIHGMPSRSPDLTPL